MSSTPKVDAPTIDSPIFDSPIFDSHCHLGFHPDADAETLWQRARASGIYAALDVGVDLASSRAAQARARALDGVAWSAGLHPTSSGEFNAEWGGLRALCAEPDCVAVGETGMDFYWDKATPQQQEHSFRAHLELAQQLRKPVIIHCRDAFPATFAILTDYAPVAGIMHCFSGGPDECRHALDLGLHISLAGPLTYKKNDALRAAARIVPNDRLLVETDAPFLPPQSRRGKRNEPAFITETVAGLAAARDARPADIADATYRNACVLLGLLPRRGCGATTG